MLIDEVNSREEENEHVERKSATNEFDLRCNDTEMKSERSELAFGIKKICHQGKGWVGSES